MSNIKFNKEQLEAINHKEGACAVIAGAGSGKSTVLVNRIKKLVEDGVNEEKIVAITFTNNSSRDLKNKLNKLGINNIVVGTFHSICKRILLSEGIDANKTINSFEVENEFRKISNKPKMNDIMSFISYQKSYSIGINDEFVDKDSGYCEEDLRMFYSSYEKLKKERKAMDFDDWLIKARDVLRYTYNSKKYTYDYILVDEHQDSNLIQNDIIDLLCPSKNIFCVFDYRQAIYTFRGGNPEYCMNFKQRYRDSKIINLDINYRSSSEIIKGANRFIRKYYSDYEYYSDSKSSSRESGTVDILNFNSKQDEAEKIVECIKNDLANGVAPNEIAVLYRMNQHSFEIENELKKNKISYHTSAKNSFFNRREINAIICILRLIDNPDDDGAFEEIFNFRCYPISYISKQIFGNIVDLSARKNISLFEACEVSRTNKEWERRSLDNFRRIILSLVLQNNRNIPLIKIIENIITLFKFEEYIEDRYDGIELEERLASLESLKLFVRDNTLSSLIKFVYSSNKTERKNNKNDIQLMTVHKSKGLEFEKTYVIGIEDEKFPHINSNEIDEARLFYVAITRAKKHLVMSQIYEGNQFIDEYINY